MLRILVLSALLLATACTATQKARDPSGAGPATVTDHSVEGGLANP